MSFSQDSINVICFVVGQLEIPKIDFQKMTSLPSIGFWVISQPKIMILAWNFVQQLVTHSSITYIPVFRISIKIWFFWHLLLKTRTFDFRASKTQNFENTRWPFCRALNFTLLCLLVAFYFKIIHSRSIWMLANFRPEIACHDVTKTPFSKKKLLNGFADILLEDVKLMLNKVP